MVREIISVGVGQCGIQLSDSVWHQYCMEHSIDITGVRNGDHTDDDSELFTAFFGESKKSHTLSRGSKYVPRNIFIDMDPHAMEKIRNDSEYSGIYTEEMFVRCSESAEENTDAGNNCNSTFGYGYGSATASLLDLFSESMRKQSDKCCNFQGFMIYHSLAGGVGSGFAAKMWEHLSSEYGRKKSKIAIEFMPDAHTFAANHSQTQTRNSVAIYNAVFALHSLLEFTDVSVILDNDRLQTLCRERLQRFSFDCDYDDINRVVSKFVSGMTLSLRSYSDVNTDLQELVSNLVCFPRLHTVTASLAPLMPRHNNHRNLEAHQSLVSGFVRECDLFAATANNHRSANINHYTFLSSLIHDMYALHFLNIPKYKYKYNNHNPNNDNDNENENGNRNNNGNNDIKNSDRDRSDSVLSMYTVCEMAFDGNQYFMYDINGFDPQNALGLDQNMALLLNVRGEGIDGKYEFEANAVIQELKVKRKFTLVDWCPTGVRLCESDVRWCQSKSDPLRSTKWSASVLHNNCCISRYFKDKLAVPFDTLYANQSCFKSYFDAGMEAKEFENAREDMNFLLSDYADVTADD